ncbi:hypothetical protein LguiA_006606 [Lonicera macranthoides]
MMCSLLFVCLISSFLLIFYKLITHSNKIQHKNLPPSPPKLPIIGYFHLLKAPFPQALNKLSKLYGSIYFIRLGIRPVLVVSDPLAVEDCFTKNDTIFASRPNFASRRKLEYNFTTIGSAPYGHHWRNLRRFSVIEIFSSSRVQTSSNIRAEEINFFTKKMFSIGADLKVDLKSFFYMLSFNIMMKMLLGNRYFEEDELDSINNRDKYDYVKQIFSPSVASALGDFFPFMKWFTFLGVARKNTSVHKRRDLFAQTLIDTHKRNRSSSPREDTGRPKTIIDVMLSLQELEPEFYTDDLIKGFIQTMLVGGTETSAMTMESAATFLILHPNVISKSRDEIDSNVEKSRVINDGDLSKLAYLQCILNETLRLGPTVPILPPREASEDCVVGGFNVQRGTMLLVNTSVLHKDPNLWEDPAMFKPERFESCGGEKGVFKFIPFGSGRRQCPGANLAMKLMALALGTLIQCFDWEKAEEEETTKIIFRPRPALVNALSQL